MAIIRLTLLLGIVLTLFAAGLVVGPNRVGELFEVLSGSAWGALLFILLYAVLTILMAPGSVSTLAGGAIFGFGLGFGLTMAGATLGAIAAFLISRRAGRGSVQTLLGDKALDLDGWVNNNGLTAILILRLIPVVPFNVLNYGAGLTVLDLRRYTLGTTIGIVPGVALITSIGASASEPRGPRFILSLLGMALLVAVSGSVAKRLRKRRSSDLVDTDCA